MQGVLGEIFNMPLDILLAIAREIGPAAFGKLQEFLALGGDNMRFYLGGALWLLFLFGPFRFVFWFRGGAAQGGGDSGNS